jgi:hypothetical protein
MMRLVATGRVSKLLFLVFVRFFISCSLVVSALNWGDLNFKTQHKIRTGSGSDRLKAQAPPMMFLLVN